MIPKKRQVDLIELLNFKILKTHSVKIIFSRGRSHNLNKKTMKIFINFFCRFNRNETNN